MERAGADRTRVLALLEEAGELTLEAVREVARETGVPEAEVWGAGRFYTLLKQGEVGLRVCDGLACQALGAGALMRELEARGLRYTPASCLGRCDSAPAAVGPDFALWRGRPGAVSPDDPELPINLAGSDDDSYAALERARAIGPEAVLQEVEAAGLQGRGGAGFPSHIKWRSVRDQPPGPRYVICNADEAEPGTFKDRETMLRRPHRVLEGLAIAALAVGAEAAWIYVRGEFPECMASLQRAAAAAGDRLGLPLRFVAGHGAYICGEETALIASIEGRRGMPALRPPYPTERGLFGAPTLVNNVETLACLPSILLRGGAWFRSRGRTEPGSKLYCISGHVARPGVYELPLGVSLDELVEVAGGYVGTPRAFAPGGASAGFLPIARRGEPLDFSGRAGAALGSAGVTVLNDAVDLARMAWHQAVFFENESCGQCAPCRVGTRVLRRALGRYLEGGDPAALDWVSEITWELEEGSICGLGVAAAAPIRSAMRHFPEDFGPRTVEAS